QLCLFEPGQRVGDFAAPGAQANHGNFRLRSARLDFADYRRRVGLAEQLDAAQHGHERRRGTALEKIAPVELRQLTLVFVHSFLITWLALPPLFPITVCSDWLMSSSPLLRELRTRVCVRHRLGPTWKPGYPIVRGYGFAHCPAPNQTGFALAG